MTSGPFSECVRAIAFGCIAVALLAAVPKGSAQIVDSGSTNTSGYRIVVQSDGSAAISVQQVAKQYSTPKAFAVSKETATRFFADLAAARKGNATTVPCMKSASFGTTLHVTWQGWTSPDLSCPPKGSLGAALIADVQAIREASGVSAVPLRRGSSEVPPR
jgi:hypothetical protein